MAVACNQQNEESLFYIMLKKGGRFSIVIYLSTVFEFEQEGTGR